LKGGKNDMAKMDNSIQKTLIIMGGVILLAVIGIITYSSFSPSNTVAGNGQASIKVTPDVISVYFNIQTHGETSQEASANNSEIVDDLRTALIKEGFESDQIQTVSFNLYPDYDYSSGKQTENGFIATHSIKVELSTADSGKIGKVIDAGVSAGAGISYINFELSSAKQSEYKAQALTEATEDARAKAQAIATGLGKNLGRLVSVSDNTFNYNPWRMYSASDSSVGGAVSAEAAKVATTSITPSEEEVSASVTAVYKLS
jgi:uncharacterized protein